MNFKKYAVFVQQLISKISWSTNYSNLANYKAKCGKNILEDGLGTVRPKLAGITDKTDI